MGNTGRRESKERPRIRDSESETPDAGALARHLAAAATTATTPARRHAGAATTRARRRAAVVKTQLRKRTLLTCPLYPLHLLHKFNCMREIAIFTSSVT